MRSRFGWSWATLVLGVTAVLAAQSGTAAPDPVARTVPVGAPSGPGEVSGSGEVAVSVRVLPPGDGGLPVTGTGLAPEWLTLLGATVLLLGVLLVLGARRAIRRNAD